MLRRLLTIYGWQRGIWLNITPIIYSSRPYPLWRGKNSWYWTAVFGG